MTALERWSHQSADVPTRLMLADGSWLEALQPVRIVPGKRIVCRAHWREQAVYVKLFVGRAARRRARRDARGVMRLRAAGIDTPALLHDGALAAEQGAHALVFAAIEHGVDAEALWPQLDSDGRLALACRLVDTVARHHAAGLLQADLYLKNFLVRPDRIDTLDGDGIRALPRFFARAATLENLALLLSKFDVTELDAWLPQLLQTYVRRHPLALSADEVRRRADRQRRRAVRRYADEKVLRRCTDVAVVRGWRRFLAIVRGHAGGALQAGLLQAPDALIDGAGALRLKNGNTCTVSRVQIDGRSFAVKRYNIKNARHRLGRLWRRSRAAVSWSNAHRLRMYGIATAAPVALLEHRYGPLRGRAWFVAEYVDAPDIARWLEADALDDARRRAGLEALARLMHKLWRLRIVHGDLKASNIQMPDGQPLLLDLDSLRELRCRGRFITGHERDLRRLFDNWRDQPAVRRMLVRALAAAYGRDAAWLSRVLPGEFDKDEIESMDLEA